MSRVFHLTPNYLRECRRALAEEQGIPAYMIFHDATLMEMVAQRPQSLAVLAEISGVGERKLEAYGEAFLEVLQAHSDDGDDAPKLDTVEETLTLFRLGMDVEAVAAQRGLKSTTIYGHLATAIACGEVRLNDVVTLAEHELRAIETAFEQCGNGKQIKPVFEALGGEYDYGVLRCVQAALLDDGVVE